jgi:hypothetical protein
MSYYDEYDHDYDNLACNYDDLYLYEDDTDVVDSTPEWDNYYHNIADELVDE